MNTENTNGWSCHARRGFAFCHPVGSAVRAGCVIQASPGTPRVHRQELRVSAAVVFEHGFGVVQETASRRSEKGARVRAHLAPEVQPIYYGGPPNEPDLSPDTRSCSVWVSRPTQIVDPQNCYKPRRA